MAILRAGWHPYTFKRVKRDVDRLVARCERMWKRLKDWVRTGARNRPQPPVTFSPGFWGNADVRFYSRIKAGVTSDARQVTSARSADRFQGLPGLSQVYPDRRLFSAKNWLLASDFPENQPSQRIGAASTKDWR